MGLISKIKGWLTMRLTSKVKEEFNVAPISTAEMDAFIQRCENIYRGYPEWVDEEGHIKTVNFAKAICSETARLATLGISVKVDGGARGEWLQEQIESMYFNLRHWVEYGCAYGTVVLKPNGRTVEAFTPGRFYVTEADNGEITGAVFQDYAYDSIEKKHYHRLEYHRFIGEGESRVYVVTNRCFVAQSANDNGKPVSIEFTPWSDLAEEVMIQNVKQPLYGVFRTPQANNIDIDSAMGMPIFAEAIEELKDLDIAYSRNVKEILDSKRLTIIDSDRLMVSGQKVKNTAQGIAKAAQDIGLPDYIKALGSSSDNKEVYHEINPELNTEMRLKGIDALLSQIGYKVGFANGHFVFDQSTGIQTATGVEAEQQRTIQFIKDVRDKLEDCVKGLIYALSVFADLYGYSPAGEYEVNCNFGDITYNEDEDRTRWYGYALQGKIPFWFYLQKFEGFTEEDAKALIAQAQTNTLPYEEEE